MIDKIHFRTAENMNGKKFDQVRIWIAGIPFSADFSPYVGIILERLAKESGIYISDTRNQSNDTP